MRFDGFVLKWLFGYHFGAAKVSLQKIFHQQIEAGRMTTIRRMRGIISNFKLSPRKLSDLFSGFHANNGIEATVNHQDRTRDTAIHFLVKFKGRMKPYLDGSCKNFTGGNLMHLRRCRKPVQKRKTTSGLTFKVFYPMVNPGPLTPTFSKK